MARPRIINVRHATTPEVWACRWCGYSREVHGPVGPLMLNWSGAWFRDPRWHEYEMPTPEQIRARMKARGMIKT